MSLSMTKWLPPTMAGSQRTWPGYMCPKSPGHHDMAMSWINNNNNVNNNRVNSNAREFSKRLMTQWCIGIIDNGKMLTSLTTLCQQHRENSMHAMSRSSTFTRHGRGRHCQRCRPKNSEHMSCVFKSIVSHSSWTAPPQTKLVSGLWQGVAILFVVSDQRALDLSLMSQTALHCLVCRGMVLQNNLTLTCHWDQRLARNIYLLD